MWLLGGPGDCASQVREGTPSLDSGCHVTGRPGAGCPAARDERPAFHRHPSSPGGGERRFWIPPVKGTWNTIEHPRERPLANSLASPTSLSPPLLSPPSSGATAIQRELPSKPFLRGPVRVAPALPAIDDDVGVHPLNPITIISYCRGSPKERPRCPFAMFPSGGEECAKINN